MIEVTKLNGVKVDINERFIEAKGEIDNYLTGLLLNMKENVIGKQE